jgi:hypothetical protein
VIRFCSTETRLIVLLIDSILRLLGFSLVWFGLVSFGTASLEEVAPPLEARQATL